jgi:hypothetical protein
MALATWNFVQTPVPFSKIAEAFEGKEWVKAVKGSDEEAQQETETEVELVDTSSISIDIDAPNQSAVAPAPTVVEEVAVESSGWLEKKGDHLKQWRRRFFAFAADSEPVSSTLSRRKVTGALNGRRGADWCSTAHLLWQGRTRERRPRS